MDGVVMRVCAAPQLGHPVSTVTDLEPSVAIPQALPLVPLSGKRLWHASSFKGC